MVGAALVAAFAVSGCGQRVDAYMCLENRRAHNEIAASIEECSATPSCRVEQSSIIIKQRIEGFIKLYCGKENANR